MNNLQQAYLRGFSKTAEDSGVDPSALIKSAFSGGIFNRAARRMKNFGRNVYRGVRNGLEDAGARLQGAWEGLTDRDAWNAGLRNSGLDYFTPSAFKNRFDTSIAGLKGAWNGLTDRDMWGQIARGEGFNQTVNDFTDASRRAYRNFRDLFRGRGVTGPALTGAGGAIAHGLNNRSAAIGPARMPIPRSNPVKMPTGGGNPIPMPISRGNPVKMPMRTYQPPQTQQQPFYMDPNSPSVTNHQQPWQMPVTGEMYEQGRKY